MTGFKSKKAAAEAKVETPAWWPSVENILKEYGLQAIDFVSDFKEAIAAAEKQEPVAYIHRNEYGEYRLEPHDDFDIKSIPLNVDVALFKSPQRQPLTDEEIEDIWADCPADWDDKINVLTLARAIEAAHGIGENNGTR